MSLGENHQYIKIPLLGPCNFVYRNFECEIQPFLHKNGPCPDNFFFIFVFSMQFTVTYHYTGYERSVVKPQISEATVSAKNKLFSSSTLIAS